MGNKLKLAGQRFGKLVALRESGRDPHGAVLWLCRCDCGKETTARGAQLRSGVTASCGCGVAETARQPRTHGATGTPLYLRWRAMLCRCLNSNNSEFHNYGGRGITICDQWRSFEGFAADMATGFSPDLELDRRETDGNYEPSNCRWITRREQQLNKRTNHRVEWRGRTLTIQEWSELLGLKPNTIVHRLRRGWPVERAMAKDVDQGVLLEIANR